jgi:hypothetical protein
LTSNPYYRYQYYSPRLFALIIGINTYNPSSKAVSIDRGSQVLTANSLYPALPSFTNLRGAVADAEHFHTYLTSKLGVPEKQITLLREKDATREEIIAAFQRFSEKGNGINKGDSIVIFYAGHGAQARPPKRLLGTDGCPEYVELLVPYDYNKIPGNQENMGIPDYTLAALINAIARSKGDNIVGLIFTTPARVRSS